MSEHCECMTLKVKDIQRILGIGQVSAYNLIHSNSFPVTHIGRSYRIPKSPFFAWMEAQQREQEESAAAELR